MHTRGESPRDDVGFRVYAQDPLAADRYVGLLTVRREDQVLRRVLQGDPVHDLPVPGVHHHHVAAPVVRHPDLVRTGPDPKPHRAAAAARHARDDLSRPAGHRQELVPVAVREPHQPRAALPYVHAAHAPAHVHRSGADGRPVDQGEGPGLAVGDVEVAVPCRDRPLLRRGPPHHPEHQELSGPGIDGEDAAVLLRRQPHSGPLVAGPDVGDLTEGPELRGQERPPRGHVHHPEKRPIPAPGSPVPCEAQERPPAIPGQPYRSESPVHGQPGRPRSTAGVGTGGRGRLVTEGEGGEDGEEDRPATEDRPAKESEEGSGGDRAGRGR